MRAGFFKFFDFFADELEAGENIYHGHAVCFTDFVGKLGADNGFDCRGIGRQFVFKFSCFNNIGKKHNADLISGKRYKFAVCGAHDNAGAVGVRVGSDEKVATFVLGDFHS